MIVLSVKGCNAHAVFYYLDFNPDRGIFVGVDSVFEDIFDQRHHQEGSDLQFGRSFGNEDRPVVVVFKAQFLQVNVLFTEAKIIVELHYQRTVGFQQVPQNFGKFQDISRCFLRFQNGDRVDVVQAVEQEMRLQLVFQILEFRLVFVEFYLPGFPVQSQ